MSSTSSRAPTTTRSDLVPPAVSAARLAVTSGSGAAHHDGAITDHEIRLAGSHASPFLRAELEVTLALGVGEVLLNEDPTPPVRRLFAT